MTRVLVTGASGFVGRHLCAALAAQFEVHAAIRESSTRGQNLDALPITVMPFVDDAQAVELVLDLKPDIVYHLATLFPSASQMRDVHNLVDANVRFGACVAQAATESDARFINISSSWQHVGGARYSPKSLYAATKQAFTDILTYYREAEGLAAVDVCLFDTFGPDDDRGKLVSKLIEVAASGEVLRMSSGTQLINLTHVDDVTRALKIAAECAVGDYVVRAEHSVSIRELASLIESVTGCEIAIEWGALPSRPREMDSDWHFGETLPGWEPQVPLAAGLEQLWEQLDV